MFVACVFVLHIGRLDDESGKYYDIIVYNRPLSSEEIKNYELDEL